MVNLADALTVLYPNATPLVDYTVSDDGTGPAITDWSAALGPIPSAETLAAVAEDQVAAARQQRATMAALSQTLGGMNAAAISDRVTLRYVLTLLNDVREHLGLPRIQEADHLAGIQVAIAAGAAEPIQLAAP